MTTNSEKLPEWRKTLNKAAENYQSVQSWYEENQDSLSAEQDVDAAAGEIEKLIKQCGVLIVLNLLDEINELQEHRKADSAEPISFDALNRRADYYAELEAMTPEQRAEHDSGIAEFKAMLPQPAPVVLGGFEHWWSHVRRGFTIVNANVQRELQLEAWNACRESMLQAGNSPVTQDGLSTVCAETYQVIGVMADALGIFDDAEVQKVLDNLSQQKLVHSDVLPFSLPAPQQEVQGE